MVYQTVNAMVEEKKASLAKNTAVLYARMMVQMVVYLYTSRVIANVLGVVDWGIFDVVGGIVLVMAFLNNAMTVCSQRYLTYAIGYGDKSYFNRVFSTSLFIHILIALLLVIVGETVGLWYLCENVVVPAERYSAALIVYHCALASSAVMIATVPFNAMVIAFEKMTAFAVISIVDVFLKLFIIMSLKDVSFDRLRMYAFLLLVEMIVVRAAYIIYCHKSFALGYKMLHLHRLDKGMQDETELTSDRILFFNMLKFSGWSVFGNLSVVCNTQGINLLLNFIGGPLLNAARVIAFNVQTAITAFVSSFQTAMNPRITKHYATGDTVGMNELVMASSRISFMLVFVVALPLLLETPYILDLWLNRSLPEYAVLFTRFLIVVSVLDAIANPLTIAVSATGQIKKYHLLIGGILLLVLPAASLMMVVDKNPCLIFGVQVSFVCLAQVVRLLMCRDLFRLNLRFYLNEVVWRIAVVAVIGALFPTVLHFVLDHNACTSWIVILSSIISTSIATFFIGLKSRERQILLEKVLKKKTSI